MVDHEERRQLLARAVWTLLERDGPGAASVRAVVAETGLSSGSVRYFFATQSQLHRFAMEALAVQIRERVRDAAQGEPGAVRAFNMVSQLAPFTDESERELKVWLTLVAQSATDADLRVVVQAQAVEIRDFLRQVLEELAVHGARPSSPTWAEVAALNAVVDGLTLELLTAPSLLSRDQAAAVLRAALIPG